MLLSSRVPRIHKLGVFEKTRSIAISIYVFSISSVSHPSNLNTHCGLGQWQSRGVSHLASKAQFTRYPEPLQFSEVRQAVFGDSELKDRNHQLLQDNVPFTIPSLKSERIDKVRARLLQTGPRIAGTQPILQIAAIVNDMGSGGPPEVRQRALRTCNAVITNLLCQGHHFTPFMALQGLKYAQSARSSQAVAFYLDRAKAEMLYLDPVEIRVILAYFYDRIVTEPCPAGVLRQFLDTVNIGKSSKLEMKSIMNTKRLKNILGAFRRRVQANPSGEFKEAWPLISKMLLSELSRLTSDHSSESRVTSWDSIIEDSLFVARHSGVDDALYNTWLMFKQSPFMSISLSRKEKSVANKIPLSAERRRSTGGLRKSWRFTSKIPKRIVHLLIQHLIDVGQPSQAWKVVQESNASADLLSNATWSLLLDYPQDLSAWDDSIQQIVLAKYEEMVSKIENAMGLVWHGGKNGWHAMSHDWSVDESFFDGSKADGLFVQHLQGAQLRSI